jgi:hypothetical protein
MRSGKEKTEVGFYFSQFLKSNLIFDWTSLDSKSLHISSCWIEEDFSVLMRKVQLRSIADVILFILFFVKMENQIRFAGQRTKKSAKDATPLIMRLENQSTVDCSF